MICGFGGSKSQLAKAAGAEPAGQMRDEKLHAVARSTFPNPCTKHTRFGALLEVVMSKKCTPLWRAAHSQVKMYKARQLRSTFRSSKPKRKNAFDFTPAGGCRDLAMPEGRLCCNVGGDRAFARSV
jgi:hypothetical protein